MHTSPPLTDIPGVAGSSSERLPRQEAHGLILKRSVFVKHWQNYLQLHPSHIHSPPFSLCSPFVWFLLFSCYCGAPLCRRGGFLFFTWVWPLTGLQPRVIVRSSFFCQSNRESSSGPIETVDEKETNGWQRLSLADGRPPEGRLESVYAYVSVCLLWLSDRTTPILLYGPIGPSLGCGSVIYHVGMCVCESPILLCPDPFPDSGGEKCRRTENVMLQI